MEKKSSIDPTFEFEAPHFVDFANLAEEDERLDKWFDSPASESHTGLQSPPGSPDRIDLDMTAQINLFQNLYTNTKRIPAHGLTSRTKVSTKPRIAIPKSQHIPSSSNITSTTTTTTTTKTLKQTIKTKPSIKVSIKSSKPTIKSSSNKPIPIPTISSSMDIQSVNTPSDPMDFIPTAAPTSDTIHIPPTSTIETTIPQIPIPTFTTTTTEPTTTITTAAANKPTTTAPATKRAGKGRLTVPVTPTVLKRSSKPRSVAISPQALKRSRAKKAETDQLVKRRRLMVVKPSAPSASTQDTAPSTTITTQPTGSAVVPLFGNASLHQTVAEPSSYEHTEESYKKIVAALEHTSAPTTCTTTSTHTTRAAARTHLRVGATHVRNTARPLHTIQQTKARTQTKTTTERLQLLKAKTTTTQQANENINETITDATFTATNTDTNTTTTTTNINPITNSNSTGDVSMEAIDLKFMEISNELAAVAKPKPTTTKPLYTANFLKPTFATTRTTTKPRIPFKAHNNTVAAQQEDKENVPNSIANKPRWRF